MFSSYRLFAMGLYVTNQYVTLFTCINFCCFMQINFAGHAAHAGMFLTTCEKCKKVKIVIRLKSYPREPRDPQM